jgi:hypothetical protein
MVGGVEGRGEDGGATRGEVEEKRREGFDVVVPSWSAIKPRYCYVRYIQYYW